MEFQTNIDKFHLTLKTRSTKKLFYEQVYSKNSNIALLINQLRFYIQCMHMSVSLDFNE